MMNSFSKQSIGRALRAKEGHSAVEIIDFYDKFNLEKNPIAWDMLLNYIENLPKPSPVRLGSRRNKIQVGGIISSVTSLYYEDDPMDELIKIIAGALGKRDIEVIAEIHGWV